MAGHDALCYFGFTDAVGFDEATGMVYELVRRMAQAAGLPTVADGILTKILDGIAGGLSIGEDGGVVLDTFVMLDNEEATHLRELWGGIGSRSSIVEDL